MAKKNKRTTPSSHLPKKAGRAAVWLLTAGVLAFQACDQLPSRPSHQALPSTSTSVTRPSFPTQELPDSRTTKFSDCPQFFAAGTPPIVPSAPKLRELCYEAFAVLHSGSTRTPVFVAQRLNRQLVQDADEKRIDKFFADVRLPRAERAELSDYKGSGYSRGHMAPAGDMPNATAMAQSFSLANMVPQNSKQNSGPWAKIEKDTRQYALRAKGDVFVITGPVFSKDAPAIGANQVRVPSYIFKLVYDMETKRAWAHWQANASDALAGPPISYRELTRKISINLLPGMHIR